MESQLVVLSNELAALTARISPSVVAVEARRRSFSSGIHWRQNLIVTAEHAVRRDEDIAVVQHDGKRLAAKLVGRDPGSDVAVLKVDGIDSSAVDSGKESAQIRAGEIAVVIGRSPNSGPNVSMGVISAVSGQWHTWRGGHLDNYIRLDATVFPGSSGGVVADSSGNTIGMATSALSRVAGLAVPRSNIDKAIDMLLKHGKVPRGYVGLGLQQVLIPDPVRKKLSLQSEHGLIVYTVEEEGPADRGGIMMGDVLLEIDNKPMRSVEELQSLLVPESIGKSVNITALRGGDLKQIVIKIGERGKGEA